MSTINTSPYKITIVKTVCDPAERRRRLALVYRAIERAAQLAEQTADGQEFGDQSPSAAVDALADQEREDIVPQSGDLEDEQCQQ